MLEERLANLTEKSEATGSRAEELESAHSVLVDKVGALEELSANQQALIEELREGVRQKVWLFEGYCAAGCVLSLSQLCLCQGQWPGVCGGVHAWAQAIGVPAAFHRRHAGNMLNVWQAFVSYHRRVTESVGELQHGLPTPNMRQCLDVCPVITPH